MIAPRNIVVATDFGDAAEQALRYGLELARAFHSRLHVVYVTEDVAASARADIGLPSLDLQSAQAKVDADARRTLGALVTTEEMQTVDVRPVLLRGRQPARALLDFARQCDADLIVMGTHGRGGLAEFFLGSSAQKVVRSAPCPVLTVRATERDLVKREAMGSGLELTVAPVE